MAQLTSDCRRWCFIAIIALLAPVGAAAQDEATPFAATPIASDMSGWVSYGQDLADTRQAIDAGLSGDTIARLTLAWRFDVEGPVSGTPIIAEGIVIVGSYDGRLYARDLASGDERWTYDTGAQVLEPNLNINLGISGSAAIDDGMVFVGDAAATVHAVDAPSGEAIWATKVDSQAAASIWSSPIPWNGRVYVGVASISKEPGFRGSVVALDAATGEQVWQTFTVPEGADDAGVFAVPAIDPERQMLYIGTQNAYSLHPAPYGDPISILALDAASGEVRWRFAAPPGGGDGAPTDDVGFSASPNLFSVEIAGKSRDLVGEGQKSGVYWALDRDTGEVVWQTQVSPAGPLGGMEGTSGVAGGRIVVPATNWPDPAGPAASPTAISDGMVFQSGIDGYLRVYALDDGTEMFSVDLGGSVSGGIAITVGIVVLAAATPNFAPFVRPGMSVIAFAVAAGTATPAATAVSP